MLSVLKKAADTGDNGRFYFELRVGAVEALGAASWFVEERRQQSASQMSLIDEMAATPLKKNQ